ncbi:hypothetical protein QUF63_04600, partial [Anaerolineales bacterium HSG25]|nr:hypothetical protein [Anaerolineales bacterium HSG25]
HLLFDTKISNRYLFWLVYLFRQIPFWDIPDKNMELFAFRSVLMSVAITLILLLRIIQMACG